MVIESRDSQHFGCAEAYPAWHEPGQFLMSEE